jgi:GntR family transcriptional regulator of vanillate catabolism
MQSTGLERVTLLLRQMIMAGDFPPGARIAEIPLAARLGVSRTPVRLALGVLEHEGLLVSAPHKGFYVREITIVDACAVRGACEPLASQLAVERGVGDAARATLGACLAEGDALLAKGRLAEADTINWSMLNARFHGAIVDAARSPPLAEALAFNARLPLVAPDAIAFAQGLDTAYHNMQSVQAEHRDIVDALGQGQALRAASLAREHVYKSREKLRAGLERLRAEQQSAKVPGLRLVVG